MEYHDGDCSDDLASFDVSLTIAQPYDYDREIEWSDYDHDQSDESSRGHPCSRVGPNIWSPQCQVPWAQAQPTTKRVGT